MKKFNWSKIIIVLGILVFILAVVLIVLNPKTQNQSQNENIISQKQMALQNCFESGGVPKTVLCCLSVSYFPNTCLIGACGCAPENSHEIQICDCGPDKCFDGQRCVNK